MEERLKTHMSTEVKSIKTDVYQYVDKQVGDAKTDAKKTTDALEAKHNNLEATHNKRLAALEEAFDLLVVGTERALKKTSDNVVILQNFASAKDGDTEAKRKEHINNVCQAMGDGKKPKKVEHVKEGGGNELSQYTRVIFESPATVQPFISKFIEKGTKNAHNRPVFARPEVDKVVRKIRNPLVQAEKKVKDHYHGLKEKHEVRPRGTALMVDKAPVAKLVGTAVVWLNPALKAACAADAAMEEAAMEETAE